MTAAPKKIYKSAATEIQKMFDNLTVGDGVVYYHHVQEISEYIETITEPDPVIKKYDYRCPHCGRFLFRAYLGEQTLMAQRCPKCSHQLTFTSNGKKVTIASETNKPPKEAADALRKRDRNDNKAAPKQD